MFAESASGLSAFKTMMDIAKSLKDMDSANKRNAAVIELQEKILTAQATQATLLERIGDLEKQMTRFETWEREKQRYEMQQIHRGLFAYVLKEPERAIAPAHAICAHCYEKAIKSVLQSNGAMRWVEHAWFCPSCKTTFKCPAGDMSKMLQQLGSASDPVEPASP